MLLREHITNVLYACTLRQHTPKSKLQSKQPTAASMKTVSVLPAEHPAADPMHTTLDASHTR